MVKLAKFKPQNMICSIIHIQFKVKIVETNVSTHIYWTNKRKCIEIQTKSNQCTSSFFIFTQFCFIQNFFFELIKFDGIDLLKYHTFPGKVLSPVPITRTWTYFWWTKFSVQTHVDSDQL